MQSWLRKAQVSIGLLFLLHLSSVASGAQVTFFSAVGIQEVTKELVPKFEHATGHKVVVTFATLGACRT